MKKLLLVLFVAAIAFSSCRREPNPVELQYAGQYDTEDQCLFDTTFYVVEIIVPNYDNVLIIQGAGLYDTGFPIEAIATGNKLVIPVQSIEIGPGVFYEFNGSGSYSGGRIIFEYTVRTVQDGFVTNENYCIAICDKR